MKILLDENLPGKLKVNFGAAYEVNRVRDMGWLGKKNGELLGLIVFNGFDFFVTLDKNLRDQQNLDKFDITIFLLMQTTIDERHYKSL
jgi:predicted nuclease of predicted toxin-antitoxin system